MPVLNAEKYAPVFVELTSRSGLKQVSAITPAEMAEKSEKALDSSMTTIHSMAARVSSMIDALADHPTQVEVEFGIKFDAEIGAVISKAGMEASLNVKMTWERSKS